MSDKKVYDQAKLAFQKLELNEGNVVVVHFPHDIVHEQMALVAGQLAEYSAETGITIMCVRQGISIEELPEHIMNENGWFRFDPERMN